MRFQLAATAEELSTSACDVRPPPPSPSASSYYSRSITIRTRRRVPLTKLKGILSLSLSLSRCLFLSRLMMKRCDQMTSEHGFRSTREMKWKIIRTTQAARLRLHDNPSGALCDINILTFYAGRRKKQKAGRDDYARPECAFLPLMLKSRIVFLADGFFYSVVKLWGNAGERRSPSVFGEGTPFS